MLRGISNHNFLRVQEKQEAVRVASGAWILNIAVHSGLSLVQPQGTLGGGTVFSFAQPLGFPAGCPSRSSGRAQGRITDKLYCYFLGSRNRTIKLKITITVHTVEMCGSPLICVNIYKITDVQEGGK